MAANFGDAVCMFCNNPLADDPEACVLTITAGWTEAAGTYWCHGGCLQGATHPAIPLYLLSIRRDEPVCGTGPSED